MSVQSSFIFNDIELKLNPQEIQYLVDRDFVTYSFYRDLNPQVDVSKYSRRSFIISLIFDIGDKANASGMESNNLDTFAKMMGYIKRYPFCFVNSPLLETYTTSPYKSRTGFSIYGIQEYTLSQSSKENNVLAMTIKLVPMDYTRLFSDFGFKQIVKNKKYQAVALKQGNLPLTQKQEEFTFTSSNTLQANDLVFHDFFRKSIADARKCINDYKAYKRYGMIVGIPYVTDKKPDDNVEYEAVSVSSLDVQTRANMINKAVTDSANNEKPTDLALRFNQELTTKYVYWKYLPINTEGSAIENYTYRVVNNMAVQYPTVGASVDPHVQYIGKSPTEITLSIATTEDLVVASDDISNIIGWASGYVDSLRNEYPEMKESIVLKVRSLLSDILETKGMRTIQEEYEANANENNVGFVTYSMIESDPYTSRKNGEYINARKKSSGLTLENAYEIISDTSKAYENNIPSQLQMIMNDYRDNNENIEYSFYNPLALGFAGYNAAYGREYEVKDIRDNVAKALVTLYRSLADKYSTGKRKLVDFKELPSLVSKRIKEIRVANVEEQADQLIYDAAYLIINYAKSGTTGGEGGGSGYIDPKQLEKIQPVAQAWAEKLYSSNTDESFDMLSGEAMPDLRIGEAFGLDGNNSYYGVKDPATISPSVFLTQQVYFASEHGDAGQIFKDMHSIIDKEIEEAIDKGIDELALKKVDGSKTDQPVEKIDNIRERISIRNAGMRQLGDLITRDSSPLTEEEAENIRSSLDMGMDIMNNRIVDVFRYTTHTQDGNVPGSAAANFKNRLPWKEDVEKSFNHGYKLAVDLAKRSSSQAIKNLANSNDPHGPMQFALRRIMELETSHVQIFNGVSNRGPFAVPPHAKIFMRLAAPGINSEVFQAMSDAPVKPADANSGESTDMFKQTMNAAMYYSTVRHFINNQRINNLMQDYGISIQATAVNMYLFSKFATVHDDKIDIDLFAHIYQVAASGRKIAKDPKSKGKLVTKLRPEALSAMRDNRPPYLEIEKGGRARWTQRFNFEQFNSDSDKALSYLLAWGAVFVWAQPDAIFKDRLPGQQSAFTSASTDGSGRQSNGGQDPSKIQPYKGLSPDQQEGFKLIRDEMINYGVDPYLGLAIALPESGFAMVNTHHSSNTNQPYDPNNKTAAGNQASAYGYGQLLDSTWYAMVKRYGGKYGYEPGTPVKDSSGRIVGATFSGKALQDRNDKVAAARMFAALMSDNVAVSQKYRSPYYAPHFSDPYVVHFLGAGGYQKAMSVDPKTPYRKAFGDKAANDNPAYGNKTVGEMISSIRASITNNYKRVGGVPGKEETFDPSKIKPIIVEQIQRGPISDRRNDNYFDGAANNDVNIDLFDEGINAFFQGKNLTKTMGRGMDQCFPVIKMFMVIGSESDDTSSSRLREIGLYEIKGLSDIMISTPTEDNPVGVATFQVSNPNNIYIDPTSIAAALAPKIDTTNVTDSFAMLEKVHAMRIFPGNRISIRGGYSNNPNDLEIMFNGEIVEVQDNGGVLNVMAETFGRELVAVEYMPDKPQLGGGTYRSTTPSLLLEALTVDEVESFGRRSGLFSGDDDEDPEAKDILKGFLTYFNGEAYSAVLKNSRKDFVGSLKAVVSSDNYNSGKSRLFTNIYTDEIVALDQRWSDLGIGIYNTIGGEILEVGDNPVFTKYMYFKSTPWSIISEMAYRHPASLAMPLNYDERATMFLGFKEQMYIASDGGPLSFMRAGLAGAQSNSAIGTRLYQRQRYNRVKPVSNFHCLSSRLNILSNRMTCNKDFGTMVDIRYYTDEDDFENAINNGEVDKFKWYTMKTDDNLRPSATRSNVLEMNGTHYPMAAYRYGTKHLQKEAEKMYGGEIEIIGNPTMKAGDYAYFDDESRGLRGVIKIRECTHYFDNDGFRTVIVPGCYVEAQQYIISSLWQKYQTIFQTIMSRLNYVQAEAYGSNQVLDYYAGFFDVAGGNRDGAGGLFSFIADKKYDGYMYAGANLVGFSAGSVGLWKLARMNTLKSIGSGAIRLTQTGMGALSSGAKFVQGSKLGADIISKGGNAANAVKSYVGNTKAFGRISSFVESKLGIKLTRGTVGGAFSRLIGGSRSFLVGATNVAMANPIGLMLKFLVIDTVFGFFGDMIDEAEQTRQPLAIMPLSLNGIPYMAGLDGAVDNSWLEHVKLEMSKTITSSRNIAKTFITSQKRGSDYPALWSIAESMIK